MFYRISWIPKSGRTMYVADYADHASQQALEYAASIVDKCAVLHVDFTDDRRVKSFRKHAARKIGGRWMVALKYK